MNHHFRSYSEQQPQQQHQPLQNQPHQQLHSTTNSNNFNSNNQMDLPDSSSSSTGIIRIHSDSQQSLDRLFNLSSSQSSIPLRNRNLPASFFNPTWRTGDRISEDNVSSNGANSLHSRSTSFDHRRSQLSGTTTGNIHMRTQSTLAPMTGSNWPTSTNNTTSTSNNNDTTNQPNQNTTNQQDTNGHHLQMSSNTSVQQRLPQQQQQPLVNLDMSPSMVGQQPAPMPQQRISRYREYQTSAFESQPQATGSSRLCPPGAGNPVASLSGGEMKSPVYMDTNMTDYTSGGNVSTDYNVPNNQYYPQQSHNYFASDDSINQQKFHISHSQPYTIYDHHSTNSSSINLGGPSSQAPSSSSSNENNSQLLCIPAPALHSRSSSFDERPPHPVTHVRSQSTIANMNPIANFQNFSPQSGTVGNFARPHMMAAQSSHPSVGHQMSITPRQSTYDQATLSTVADNTAPSRVDEWTDMIM